MSYRDNFSVFLKTLEDSSKELEKDFRKMVDDFRESFVGFDRNFYSYEYTNKSKFPFTKIVDNSHTGGNVIIEVALAGYDPNDVQVLVSPSELVVQSRKQEQFGGDNSSLASRSFVKRWTKFESTKVLSAVIKNGLLRIELERKKPNEKKEYKEFPVTIS